MIKKIVIGIGVFFAILYTLFLILPLCLNGVINKQSSSISDMIESLSGCKVEINNIRLVTTPKLTAGLKIGNFNAYLPAGDKLLSADNVQAKLSLVPLLFKQIEVDMIGADNIDVSLQVKKDGHFLLEDYIPGSSSEAVQNEDQSTIASLPFGLKLSNNLPNIVINNYKISFLDISKNRSYDIIGDVFSISDFVLNKRVKVYTTGKVKLVDDEQFTYNVLLKNKIMPQADINDLVFSPKVSEEKSQDVQFINVIDIFEALYKNKLTFNLVSDLRTYGTLEDINVDGNFSVTNFSVAVDGKPLPEGQISLNLKGNKIKLDSKLYTSENEITALNGNFATGKTPKIDLSCKSNAKLKSIVSLVNSVAKSVGISSLDSLSVTGDIDADFTLKSDMKTVESSGYFKVNSASLAYKLYNIVIEKIFADVMLTGNKAEIKDAGLNILGQPLRIKGSISHDAEADISVIADKLQIKGLLLALGQATLLKENNVNSGTLSLNAILKGKLDKIVPKIFVSIDNVNIKNVPSNIYITAANLIINLTTDGVKTSGNIDANKIKILNSFADIVLPVAKIDFGEKDINIQSVYILLNNSRIDITGKIADYMTKNITFDILAKGNLLASDLKNMIPSEYRSEVAAKGALSLNISMTGNDKEQNVKFRIDANPSNYASILSISQLNGKNTNISGNIKIKGETLSFSDTGLFVNGSSIASLKGSVNDLYKSQKLNLNLSVPDKISLKVPFFPKSQMLVSGNADIVGTVLNPILKGSVIIPEIKIPEMQLTIDDMNISLNGIVARGKGTIKKLVSGGIVAENLASDFNLANYTILYLKNLTGDAFNGKINGNISYNITNGLTSVDMKGSGMDAESAIAGAAGLKNALSGKLSFVANVTTHGETDLKMMKNLKGKATFEILDGELGNIGRFENLILAENIMANPILKAGVSAIRTLPVVKNTAQFKTINGNLTFSDGWATLSPIKTAGPSMAYYITGKYNLLNATANVVILGRISAEVVKLLGPLGDLSVSKLTSLIPGIGNSTISLIQAITTNPYGEKISEIPALSSGNTNYKNFKINFNGGVESSSSVKSFRWLSVCDTSEIESFKVKDQVKAIKQAVQDEKNRQVEAFNAKMLEQRQQAKEANQELKNAAEGLKNLFKSPEKKSTTVDTTPQASTESATQESDSATE